MDRPWSRVPSWVGAALRPELAGAGLAVVGRRGAGVFRDVVLGSLAHDLVSTLPCPLAIVPMGDRDSA